MGLSNSNIKKILIFSQNKAFLTIPEMERYTFHTKSTAPPLSPPSPQKRTQPGKINLYFRKQKPQNIKR